MDKAEQPAVATKVVLAVASLAMAQAVDHTAVLQQVVQAT
jgi:hypothetical protein